MEKNIFIITIIIILVLSSFSFSSANLLASIDSPIYIDDDNTQGPWDGTIEHPYQTIQDAIDAATSGDNLYVYPGFYDIFNIDKSISIRGENQDNTIINITSKDNNLYAILIESDNVKISNFKLVGFESLGLVYFIKTNFYDNIVISNCIFTDGLMGIEVDHSKHIVISDCDFVSVAYYGIFINGLDGPDIDVKDVVISNCYFFRSGIRMSGNDASDILVSNCDFFECGLGVNPMSALQASMIYSGLVIENCYFQRNGWGIGFSNVNNAIVRNCVLYEHIKDYDISIVRALGFESTCSNNVFHSNVFAYNEFGLGISQNSHNNLIYGNYFYQNVASAGDDGDKNFWYNQTLGVGNYWDDYDGVDNDGDGIGDTPYMIPQNSHDMYPKMNLDTQIRPPTSEAPSVSSNILKKNENAEFSSQVTDPNGDNVFYKFIWEDGSENIWLGPYPSGSKCSVIHSFDRSGLYDVKVMVKDFTGFESLRSEPTSIWVSIPSNPDISGPTRGIPGESYTYKVTSTDPDDDPIWYNIRWEWANYTGWLGPYASGETISFSHTWTEQGTYDIRIAAKDSDGITSDWVGFTVQMPKQKFKNLNFFDKILEISPIIKIFLNWLKNLQLGKY